MFIFDRCHPRAAAVTTVKYECDSKNVTGTFARSKILLTEKLINRALVTPTPGQLWHQGNSCYRQLLGRIIATHWKDEQTGENCSPHETGSMGLNEGRQKHTVNWHEPVVSLVLSNRDKLVLCIATGLMVWSDQLCKEKPMTSIGRWKWNCFYDIWLYNGVFYSTPLYNGVFYSTPQEQDYRQIYRWCRQEGGGDYQWRIYASVNWASISSDNGLHFANTIFKCIFLNENAQISIKISLKFVPKGPINKISALVQIMAWRRSGDKPLFEPMMISLLMYICITRPQWVKPMLVYCQLET